MESSNQGNTVKMIALMATSVIAISALNIPFPTELITVTWALIGFCLARAFGKKLDHTIKEQTWYTELDPLPKWFIGAILDFFHHFWIGLLIMIRIDPDQIVYIFGEPVSFYYFGWGIFIDDLPDIPERFKGYFKYLMDP